MRDTAEIALLRGFWRDRRGSAAIEFGILAPVLMLMLLGAIELGNAVSNDRHFASAIAATGDLVARAEYLGDTSGDAGRNLADMMDAIPHMLRPYDPSPLKLAIYSVKVSAKDPRKGKVEWVYRYNDMKSQAQCSDYTLPSDIVAPGGSVIIVDGEYKYRSLFGDYIPGMGSAKPWSEKSYHTPRNACVDYVKGDNCISHC